MENKTPKIFFASNLRFLRERRQLSQHALADTLQITRAKLAALESAQTKAPQPEDLVRCSDLFKISIDSLLKVDLSRLSELKLRELEAGNDVYLTGSNIRVLAVTTDKNNNENLEYVPVKAKAGYRSGYNDPEFMAALPKFSMPALPRSKTFRMFPTTGDSMLPFPESADIIGEYVEDWKALKPDTPCVVILKAEGHDFVFKLLSYRQKENDFLLRSLNELYAPYTVLPSEILEVWKYHSHHTTQLPQSLPLHQLMNAITVMQGEIRELKGK